jgi:hypothetical protein
VSPYSLRYDVTSDNSVFDLATVSSAVFAVRRERSRVETSWSCTLSNQTSTTLRLEHVFASGDVPEPDTITIEPRLTTPSGDLICQPATVTVRPRFT